MVSSIALRARSFIITRAAHGDALHPFCGALIRISTPAASISTQIVPDAIQSNTNNPPTSRTASDTARIYSSERIMPEDVSTCGEQTSDGLALRMAATTSSTGAGAKDGVALSSVGRAFRTVHDAGISPASKIWLQRKLNQPLRRTTQSLSFANCRATASIP